MSSAPFFILFSVLLMAGPEREVACQRVDVSELKNQMISMLQYHANPLVQPDSNGGPASALMVNISLTLTHIAEMEEATGRVKALGYLSLAWTDRRLRYPQSSMGHNITFLSMEASSIWIPDIELYNTDTPSMQNLNRKDLALVFPTGQVMWVPQLALTTFCHRIVEQESPLLSFNCTLTFGSWVSSAEDMDLHVPDHLDMSEFSPNPHWRLESPSARRVERQFACCVGTYVMAEFSFRLVNQ